METALEVPVPPTGQAEFTTPGTYTWVCPAGVTSVCVVCVGGGGGGSAGSADAAGNGGGVGIYGEGASELGGQGSTGDAFNGQGGSGGGDGGRGYGLAQGSSSYRNIGGDFGGGGGGADNSNGEHGNGAGGAVRIIWGEGRAFPSTNTADMTSGSTGGGTTPTTTREPATGYTRTATRYWDVQVDVSQFQQYGPIFYITVYWDGSVVWQGGGPENNPGIVVGSDGATYERGTVNSGTQYELARTL